MSNPIRALRRACYRVYINLNRLCGGIAGEELPVAVEPEKKELVGICPVCLKKTRVITFDRTSWKFAMGEHTDKYGRDCEGVWKIPCEVY